MDLDRTAFGDINLVFIWGITVFLGYILTTVLSFNPIGLEYSVEYQIVAMWFVLMSLPIGMTVKKILKTDEWTRVGLAWASLILIGLLGNIYGIVYLMDEQLLFLTYFQKWFLLPAALFAYTAYKTQGYSKKVYSVSAVLNMLYGIALFIFPELAVTAFPLAAVIQGGPMLLDWWHHR